MAARAAASAAASSDARAPSQARMASSLSRRRRRRAALRGRETCSARPPCAWRRHSDWLKNTGGGRELVEDEQERAEQEDEELHRNLQEGIEHQAEAAFAQGGAADVALHLGLVGAEIGEREKQAAEEAGPERVAPARIERHIDRLQLAQGTGNVRGATEAEPVGQLDQQDDQGRHHAAEDHRHLPLLGQADRFAAARHGVDDDEEPGEHDDEIQPPAQHGGEDDGGRVDGHARRRGRAAAGRVPRRADGSSGRSAGPGTRRRCTRRAAGTWAGTRRTR